MTTMDLLSEISWRYLGSQRLASELKEDLLPQPSWESRMRWSRTRACTRTSACMHRRVMLACFRTLCPLTRACSFTSPRSARSALLACAPSPPEQVHRKRFKFCVGW